MFLRKVVNKIISKKKEIKKVLPPKNIKSKISKEEKKVTKRQKELLNQYNEGRIIKVDKDIDNKDFLKSENCKEYLEKLKNEKPKKITEDETTKDNAKLEEEICKLIKEQPNLKVKTYLRILLKKFKGNLNQEKTRELIKEKINKNEIV